MGVAVFVDGRARDEIHHEVGAAVGRGAAVQQLGDIRMIQVGQNLAFDIEAAQRELAEHAAADHFDRHHFAIQIVHPHRLVDGAHAAFGDQLHDAVGSQVAADSQDVGPAASAWARRPRALR